MNAEENDREKKNERYRDMAEEMNAVEPLEEWTNSIGMRFRLIPAGTFQMGSPGGEPGRNSNEVQHQVTLSQPFWMGVTEVTQAQWEAVMGTNPSCFKGPNRPVENVSWNDAVAFFEKLSAKEPGVTYRLPTEAEWEYACRAGSTHRYYWHWSEDLESDLLIDDYEWYGENSGKMKREGGQNRIDWWDLYINLWISPNNAERRLTSHGVGEKKSNRWGLYDMAGNVKEWCADWYGNYPAGPVTDPKGPTSGSRRVLRGGSWNLNANPCRSACRWYDAPDSRSNYYGFRLARTP